ncbi:MAG TPA: hypothetical protein VMH41_03505 [Mycobacteriales bacterium]|nr:hypothetical protein [Mycobacteriales bacterium]
MKEKCATPGCRNDARDRGLCRKCLRGAHEEKTREVESSPVGPSEDRGYHARAAAGRVAQGDGVVFTKAYLALAAEGRRLERDDPLPDVAEGDHPCI